MTKPFSNNLSDAELERIILVEEEMNEIGQLICKIIRHGYESAWPPGGETNRQALERELGDLNLVIQLMIDKKDIDFKNIMGYSADKVKRINKYLHHNHVPENFLD